MTKTIEIPLTRGYVTLIDEDDYDIVSQYKWHATTPSKTGLVYATSYRAGRLHRLIMQPPKGLIVDHRNRDSLDNRRSNLRIGTHAQNRVNGRNHGKYLKGVRWHINKGRFEANIRYRGRQHHLGYFKTEQEAHEAYVRAAVELHGDWVPAELRT